jgi:hypothetical protein
MVDPRATLSDLLRGHPSPVSLAAYQRLMAYVGVPAGDVVDAVLASLRGGEAVLSSDGKSLASASPMAHRSHEQAERLAGVAAAFFDRHRSDFEAVGLTDGIRRLME